MKLIEQGWDSYRMLVVPPDATEVQVIETRQAFFAGAAVLFQTVMRSLSPGEETTPEDEDFMRSVQTEIDDFGAELDRKILHRDS